jgi:hypothetical protein
VAWKGKQILIRQTTLAPGISPLLRIIPGLSLVHSNFLGIAEINPLQMRLTERCQSIHNPIHDYLSLARYAKCRGLLASVFGSVSGEQYRDQDRHCRNEKQNFVHSPRVNIHIPVRKGPRNSPRLHRWCVGMALQLEEARVQSFLLFI